MRSAFAALLLAALGAAPALAETRCEPVDRTPEVYAETRDVLPQLQDYGPDFTCRSDDGLMLTPERDASGAPILRDMQGARVEGHADGFGVIIYPDVPASPPLGPQQRITTFVEPATGTATHILPSGRVEQSAVDPLGNSVVRDEQGGIKRCWTDPVGVTICD
jgi:hypothetical protein